MIPVVPRIAATKSREKDEIEEEELEGLEL